MTTSSSTSSSPPTASSPGEPAATLDLRARSARTPSCGPGSRSRPCRWAPCWSCARSPAGGAQRPAQRPRMGPGGARRRRAAPGGWQVRLRKRVAVTPHWPLRRPRVTPILCPIRGEARRPARPPHRLARGRGRVLGRRRLGVPARGRRRGARRALPRGDRGVADDGALRDRRRARARAGARPRRPPPRRRVARARGPRLRRQPDASLRAVQDRADGRRRARSPPRSAARRSRSAPTSTISATCAPASPPPASAVRGCRSSTPRCRRPRSARCRASSGCAPGTSRSSPACRRGFRTARRSRADRLRRVDASRTACASSASASCACASTTRSRGSRSRATSCRAWSRPASASAIVALGKRLGFTYVALDLAGFRSGSLNEVLPAETLVQLRGPRVVKLALALALLLRSSRRRAAPLPTRARCSKKDRERAREVTEARAPRCRAPGRKPAQAHQPLQHVDARVARGRCDAGTLPAQRPSIASCAITSPTSRRRWSRG